MAGRCRWFGLLEPPCSGEKDWLTQPEPDSKMQKRKRRLRDIKCRDQNTWTSLWCYCLFNNPGFSNTSPIDQPLDSLHESNKYENIMEVLNKHNRKVLFVSQRLFPRVVRQCVFVNLKIHQRRKTKWTCSELLITRRERFIDSRSMLFQFMHPLQPHTHTQKTTNNNNWMLHTAVANAF